MGLVCCVGSCTQGGERERGERKSLKKRERRRQTTGDERLTHVENPTRKMPNFAGTWKMKSSENFEDLLKTLGEDNLLFFFPMNV